MTATYDLTTTVGKIRLKIGDTTLSDVVFTDEELTYFYTEQGSITLASAAALEAWAAKYGANADSEKIGDYAYSQKIIDKLLAMAQNLRDTDANEPVLDTGAFNLTDMVNDDDI